MVVIMVNMLVMKIMTWMAIGDYGANRDDNKKLY